MWPQSPSHPRERKFLSPRRVACRGAFPRLVHPATRSPASWASRCWATRRRRAQEFPWGGQLPGAGAGSQRHRGEGAGARVGAQAPACVSLPAVWALPVASPHPLPAARCPPPPGQLHEGQAGELSDLAPRGLAVQLLLFLHLQDDPNRLAAAALPPPFPRPGPLGSGMAGARVREKGGRVA